MPKIHIQRPENRVEFFSGFGKKDSIFIGRALSNDIVLPDELVSRIHAGIEKTRTGYRICDLDSNNGLFVNGNRVVRHDLRHYDRIEIGSTLLTFLNEDEDTDQEILVSMRMDHKPDSRTGSLKISSDSRTWEARSHSELQRINKVLYVLYQISAKLNRTSDLDELLGTIMDLVFVIIEADYGFIAVTCDGPELVAPKIIKSRTRDKGREDDHGLRISEAITRKVIEEGLSVITSNAMEDRRFDGSRSIRIQKIRSVMSVPLWRKDEVIGMIQLDSYKAVNPFTRSDLDLLSSISSQVAMIIEQADLNEKIRSEQQQAYENLELMAEERKQAAEKIREMNVELEKRVAERTCELNDALEKVKTANLHVMDSIRYARRIQLSLLPDSGEIRSFLSDHFIIWMPRDVVGGDIYYLDEIDGKGFIAAMIDCTGHGVPGAFMTMIASSGLRRIIREEKELDPAEILRKLNFFVKTSLQQDTEYSRSDDGLDAAVCTIVGNRLTYAGSKLPMICINGDEFIFRKGDRLSIGYRNSDLEFPFTNHCFELGPKSRIYLYTDGFIDQLGGNTGHSFGHRRFRELLAETSRESFSRQKKILLSAFHDHRGDEQMQDDVTVLGMESG